MSETFTMRLAEPDTIYAESAFGWLLGKAMPVMLPDGSRAEGILTAVSVPGDCTFADLTFAVPDGTLTPPGVSAFSINRNA